MDWCCLSTDSTLNRRQRSLYSVLRAEGCLGLVCLPPCVGSPSYPTFCSAKLKHFPIKWKEGNANPNFLLLHKMRLNVQICRAGQSEDHKQKFRFLDWKFLLSPEPTQPWQGCKHSSALHFSSILMRRRVASVFRVLHFWNLTFALSLSLQSQGVFKIAVSSSEGKYNNYFYRQLLSCCSDSDKKSNSWK